MLAVFAAVLIIVVLAADYSTLRRVLGIFWALIHVKWRRVEKEEKDYPRPRSWPAYAVMGWVEQSKSGCSVADKIYMYGGRQSFWWCVFPRQSFWWCVFPRRWFDRHCPLGAPDNIYFS